MEEAKKINTYTCSQGHVTVTVNKDTGTTPMMITCRTKNCGQTSRSAWYNCEQTLHPEYEWFKPVDIKKVSKHLREHVKLGGLLIRKIAK